MFFLLLLLLAAAASETTTCPASAFATDTDKKYEISQRDKDQLLIDGYLSLSSAVPPQLLARLREMADRLEQVKLAEFKATGMQPKHAAIFETSNDEQPVLERLDKLLEADPDTVLDLLATPAMIAVFQELCETDCVPIEMDILYKRQHPNGYVIWHQGAQHSRKKPYLNVGVYLDDAPADDGCLRYVPATQFEKQNICSLASKHGWDVPGSIDVPAKAGYIIVQDMMILHCSLPKLKPGVRRTIYIELRPAEAIIEGEAQSAKWAELRRRWMALVVNRAGISQWPWPLPKVKENDVQKEIADIASLSEPPIPAHYCNRPVNHPDYPIPARLR